MNLLVFRVTTVRRVDPSNHTSERVNAAMHSHKSLKSHLSLISLAFVGILYVACKHKVK